MEWTSETVERLYQRHKQYVSALKRDIANANRSLGSSNPEKTELRHLSRSEFEALLTDLAEDPEALNLWIRRITRGYEHEFPELQAAG